MDAHERRGTARQVAHFENDRFFDPIRIVPRESVNAELSPTRGKCGFGDLFETKRAIAGRFMVATCQIASIIMAPGGTAFRHAAG